ncbi:MAG TPA: nucleotidyltransferase [Candidatus Dormibacteraeota bacterium]|nr:nucleotidyltransferase [Candidatus Dormibacteraeota bacterium]
MRRGTGPRQMETVLVQAVDVLERQGIEYALMGGLASATVGRPRRTRDVDIFVAPERALPALEALGRAGFRTERTDEAWLYKAFAGDVMVDLIFRSKGGLVLDERMLAYRREVTIGGRRVLALGSEDLVVIKAMAAAEHVPRHWYDAVAILERGGIDWEYLRWRARPFAARVLSLLLYALSCGVLVSEPVLRELAECALRGVQGEAATEADHHLVARVHQALATDPRLCEAPLSVSVQAGELVVSGEVATARRREVVEEVTRQVVGAHPVRVEVRVPE